MTEFDAYGHTLAVAAGDGRIKVRKLQFGAVFCISECRLCHFDNKRRDPRGSLGANLSWRSCGMWLADKCAVSCQVEALSVQPRASLAAQTEATWQKYTAVWRGVQLHPRDQPKK